MHNNKEMMKVRLAFFHATHLFHLIHILNKFYEIINEYITIMVRTNRSLKQIYGR